MFYKKAALHTKSEKSISEMVDNYKKLSTSKIEAFTEICNTIEEVCKDKCFKEYEISRICSKLESNIIISCDDSELCYCADYFHPFNTRNALDTGSKHNSFGVFKGYLLESIKKKQCNLAVERNYDKLNKKINLEGVVSLFRISKPLIEEGIYETCDAIDLLYPNLDPTQKIAISLDTVSYSHSRNKSSLCEQEIVSNIINYFLLNENYSLSDVERGINATRYITNNDQYLLQSYQEESKTDSGKLSLNVDKRKIQAHIDDTYKSIKKSDNVKEANKEVNLLVKKLYKIPKNDMIDETPAILTFLRRVVLFGGAAIINPVLIIPAVVVDNYLSYKVNSQNVNSLISKLEKEKNKIEDKLSDDDKKKGLQKEYIKKLDIQLDRLETYRDNLKGDLEQKDEMENSSFEELASLIINVTESINTVMNEGNIQTVLITAKEKLKKATDGLSSKEKMLSRTIDQNVDKVIDGVNKSLTLHEKDKIIEGRVLPSASSVIKLAIKMGVAWMVSPALAVIGAISAIGMSKTINAKQRQLIYDELDTHIKLVGRKIEEAERKDDSAALEELYQIERKLKREKQRIQYRAKVYHNQIL